MAPLSLVVQLLLAVWFLHYPLPVSCSPLLVHQIEELAPAAASAIRKRQNGFVPVTGITQFGVQPRLEIRELEKNADQWNIYLLGLARWQATDQRDKLSYYQVAGIHGRPYSPWDGVQPGKGIDYPGYCIHVSNVFLPWHRPYLALYEQTLHQHIIAAVNEFPAGAIRQKYASAALAWRMPYWDWAATPPDGKSIWPSSVKRPTVKVQMPNGTTTIPNPLYSYRFHPVGSDDFYYNPFGSWNVTMRTPTNWTEHAVSQNNEIGARLDNSRVSFQDRLYNLFTFYDNFTQFGNEAWINPTVSNADSLESLHDTIHGITGGNGHLTYLDYSAYDPVFWLHHAMTDRCFAMWQALYNDSYVEPMAAVEQTYTIEKGAMIDEDSPLNPFHKNEAGDVWTAAQVQSTRIFGYTYSDLGNGSVSVVKANVNRLYGRSAGTSKISKRTLPGAAKVNMAVAPEEVVDGKHRQYLANIQSQKFALNGSYAIYLFMGDFRDDPASWAKEPNLVGTHAVFATLSGADASKSQRTRTKRDGTPIQVTGSIPLTSMLLAKVETGELSCLDPDTVTPYLRDNLEWRISMFDDNQIKPEELADLTVSVVSALVEPASQEDDFPRWTDFKELTSITQGKPGGCA
ncbi:Di-copper centre-containing protein [Hortaea werneckii]|nr:Di-copper centre-containing protein [Hortaea werneckii]